MLEAVINHGIIFYVMAAIMTIGVAGTAFSYITISKLAKSAGNIQKSNQRLMKLVKAKFEHASMVSDRVQNVEAFVQKYLYEYKVLGIRLGSWRNFPLKIVGVIVIVGVAGALLNYRVQGMTEQTFQYGAFAAIYAVALMSIHTMSDGKMKLDAAKNYMVEYLENVCVHRYGKANHAVKIAEETGKVAEGAAEEPQKGKLLEEEPEIKEKLNAELEQKEEQGLEEKLQNVKEEQVKLERDEQEMRIRAILQEFLA